MPSKVTQIKIKNADDVEKLVKPDVKPKHRAATELNDRITVTGFIHHEHAGDKPITISLMASLMLKTIHQPVMRRLEVGPKSTNISTEWIPTKDVGLIVVENRAGKNMLVNPNKEEKIRIDKQVLLINGVIELRPGMPAWWCVVGDYSKLNFRSANDIPVPITLYVFGK